MRRIGYVGLMNIDASQADAAVGDASAKVWKLASAEPRRLVDLIEAAFDGRLADAQCDWDPRPAVGVVLAAGGYPDKAQTGVPIEGLEAADALPGKVFHAGTRDLDGTVLTSGGRVLCATALGTTVADAREAAYALVAAVRFDGMQFRRDIAHRALSRPG